MSSTWILLVTHIYNNITTTIAHDHPIYIYCSSTGNFHCWFLRLKVHIVVMIMTKLKTVIVIKIFGSFLNNPFFKCRKHAYIIHNNTIKKILRVAFMTLIAVTYSLFSKIVCVSVDQYKNKTSLSSDNKYSKLKIL